MGSHQLLALYSGWTIPNHSGLWLPLSFLQKMTLPPGSWPPTCCCWSDLPNIQSAKNLWLSNALGPDFHLALRTVATPTKLTLSLLFTHWIVAENHFLIVSQALHSFWPWHLISPASLAWNKSYISQGDPLLHRPKASSKTTCLCLQPFSSMSKLLAQPPTPMTWNPPEPVQISEYNPGVPNVDCCKARQVPCVAGEEYGAGVSYLGG